MGETTDVFALRWPEGADPATISQYFQELAEDSEAATLKLLGWRTIYVRPFYVVESMNSSGSYYAMSEDGVMRRSPTQIAVSSPGGVIPHVHLSRAILLGSLTGLNPVVRLKAHAIAGGTDPNNGTDITCVPLAYSVGAGAAANFLQGLDDNFGTANTFEAGVTISDLAANGQVEGSLSGEQILTASETFDERVTLGVLVNSSSPVDTNAIVLGSIELQVKFTDAD